jgi:hypothetical protein
MLGIGWPRSGDETGEGSLTLVMPLPLIRHGLRPCHLLPQGEKGRKNASHRLAYPAVRDGLLQRFTPPPIAAPRPILIGAGNVMTHDGMRIRG